MKEETHVKHPLRSWAAVLLLALAAAPGLAATLHDLQGEPAELAPLIGDGRWTLVMFWAADCHVCNAEAIHYVQFHDRHHEDLAKVVGVSLDGLRGLEDARGFVDRHFVDFPNLVGEPREVARLFTEMTDGRQPWLGTPSFLLYRPDGELVGWRIGPVPVPALEEMIAAEPEGSGGS
jgi:peroxiredoxin